MNYEKEKILSPNESFSLGETLLDSSLIRQTDRMSYNAKVYQCGDYTQLYLYENTKIKKDTTLCFIKEETPKRKIIIEEISRPNKPTYREIRFDNALRSKLQLQRLIKANAKKFKTFITLTFQENVGISQANKRFNSWRTHSKRLFPDFQYISVPEFQKRGAVHYHLLTNIDYNNMLLVNQEVKKIWKPKNKEWHVFKTLNHWHNGFSSIKDLIIDNDSMNIVAYISKYVTKDIDKRLYSRKKYSYSKSLYVPKPIYFNIEDKKLYKYAHNSLANKQNTFHKIYLDKITNTKIYFFEFIPIKV